MSDTIAMWVFVCFCVCVCIYMLTATTRCSLFSSFFSRFKLRPMPAVTHSHTAVLPTHKPLCHVCPQSSLDGSKENKLSLQKFDFISLWDVCPSSLSGTHEHILFITCEAIFAVALIFFFFLKKGKKRKRKKYVVSTNRNMVLMCIIGSISHMHRFLFFFSETASWTYTSTLLSHLAALEIKLFSSGNTPSPQSPWSQRSRQAKDMKAPHNNPKPPPISMPCFLCKCQSEALTRGL